MPASPAGKVFLPNFPSNGKLSGISRWSGGKSSPSNVGVAGSIPDQGMKITHVSQP